MIRTAAHKQTQHQVFVRDFEAAQRHGAEFAKEHGFSNPKPAYVVATDLGYTVQSQRDAFVAGYRAQMQS